MQRIAFILFITGLVINGQVNAEDSLIIQASFYENSTFRGFWELKLYKDGKLLSKGNTNLLDFKNKEESYVEQIDIKEVNTICTFLKSKKYFEFEKIYTTGEGIAVDGPAVFLEARCKKLINNIVYYPRPGDITDKFSQTIVEIWDKLWSFSRIQAPSLTKYM